MFTLIIGTTRSGKSEYAERRLLELAESMKAERKVYIATSEVRDEEMMARVALHQERRLGKGFVTFERTRELGGLVLSEKDCVLIESLSVWTANEMFTNDGVHHDAGDKIYAEILSILARVKHVVIVSDDIFSDGVSYDALTEEYLRTLGGLHVKLAAIADEVIEVVSGIPIIYKSS